MTFEEFESASAAELREHARGAFNKGNTSDASWAGNTNLLLEAQFYISEIDRRHDAKIATRDFRMELIVIALILFEFIAALIGIIITIREGKAQAILEDQLMSKQTAVIQKLSDSADITAASQKATAGTLQSLQGTM